MAAGCVLGCITTPQETLHRIQLLDYPILKGGFKWWKVILQNKISRIWKEPLAIKGLHQHFFLKNLKSEELEPFVKGMMVLDRKSTRLNSSHVAISYAVFCLQKKKLHNRLPH